MKKLLIIFLILLFGNASFGTNTQIINNSKSDKLVIPKKKFKKFHKVFKKKKNTNRCINKRRYVPSHLKHYMEEEEFDIYFNDSNVKTPRFRN